MGVWGGFGRFEGSKGFCANSHFDVRSHSGSVSGQCPPNPESHCPPTCVFRQLPASVESPEKSSQELFRIRGATARDHRRNVLNLGHTPKVRDRTLQGGVLGTFWKPPMRTLLRTLFTVKTIEKSPLLRTQNLLRTALRTLCCRTTP